MTGQRKLAIGSLALVMLIGFVALYWPREEEPMYEGKTLSDWVFPYVENRLEAPPRGDVEHAITAIGTNALPTIVGWIRTLPPAPENQFSELARSVLEGIGLVPRRVIRERAALFCFGALGSRSSPAAPELYNMLTNFSNHAQCEAAAKALAYTGSNAIPFLLHGMTNDFQDVKFWCLEACNYLSDYDARIATGVVQRLADDNPDIRAHATITLAEVDRRSPWVASELLKTLTDPDSNVVTAGVLSLHRFRTNAVPILIEATTSTNAQLREAAAKVLASIRSDEKSRAARAQRRK